MTHEKPPLTFEQVKAAAERIAKNGFKGDVLPSTQMMHEGVPYETCRICTDANGFHTLHQVGVSHEECV